MHPSAFRGLAAFGAVALLIASAPARAQTWQAYDYPDAGFSAQFPAKPDVTPAEYRFKTFMAPARTWIAHVDDTDYSITVADFSKIAVDRQTVIQDAADRFAAAGEIRLDVSERIDRQFGRELRVKERDGSFEAVAIFFVDDRLYLLSGKSSGPDAEAAGALQLRFQQSLEFIDAHGKRPRRPEDGPGGGLGPERRRPRPPPEAFAACSGKSDGAPVSFQSPRGVVEASCQQTPEGLAARPNLPPPPEG